jgi:methionine synthase reductase
LTPISPRYYSIASSPLVVSNKLAIAFSIVHYTCSLTSITSNQLPPQIQRYGVCTSFLEKELNFWLNPTIAAIQNHSVPYFRIFHKPTISFRLPGSVSYPLILIGPGTGVSPFIGFLEHRDILEKERMRSGGEEICSGVWRGGFELSEEDLPCESNIVEKYIHSIKPGSIDLFFGCRNDSDYLFKTELESFRKRRILTELKVAMSRGDLVLSLISSIKLFFII